MITNHHGSPMNNFYKIEIHIDLKFSPHNIEQLLQKSQKVGFTLCDEAGTQKLNATPYVMVKNLKYKDILCEIKFLDFNALLLEFSNFKFVDQSNANLVNSINMFTQGVLDLVRDYPIIWLRVEEYFGA